MMLIQGREKKEKTGMAKMRDREGVKESERENDCGCREKEKRGREGVKESERE